MKLLHAFSCSALVLSLAACGGGGGGGEAPASTPTAQLSLGEFAGTWKLEPAANPCMDGFPFAQEPRHYRNRDIVLTAEGAQLTAVVAFEVFSDGTCTTKLGLVSETFELSPSAGSVQGRDNVIRSTPYMASFKMGADGGLGLQLNGLPSAKNNVTGWEGLKLIADVQDKKLFLSSSDSGVALDSQGFPTQFQATPVFVKQ